MSENRPTAAMELEPTLYADLREVAAAHLARERPDHTLQPTALVHEAFLRLSKSGRMGLERKDLVCLASRAMRCILVDHARRRRAEKRGGGGVRVPLDRAIARYEHGGLDLLELHSALEKLERAEPGLARIVELRFFGGLTEEETGAELGVSVRTVRRGWSFARLWLAAELKRDSGGD